jgi:glycosyltransferase involved in cell wall biosynthesis
MQSLVKKMRRWAGGYWTLIAKANAARDQRNWMVAADAYAAALAIRPDEASIWVQLGNMSKEMKNVTRAQFAYGQALFLNPNDADVHLQIGHLHKIAGDKAAALTSYAEANRLDPNNEHATAELRALGAVTGNRPLPAPAPVLSHPQAALSQPRTAPSPRKHLSRTQSFNARVLGTKSALQELLRSSTKPADTTSLEKVRPLILEAVAALENVIQGGLTPAISTPNANETGTSIVFDVSDLVQYFRNNRLPTGIQRVQIEVISVTLLRTRAHQDIRVCCFTEQSSYWREIPPDIFLELCDLSLIDGDWTAPEWRELMLDLDDLLNQADDFRFDEGAFLVNIGTSWWLQNYFLQVREAKKRNNIRYIPFVHDMIPIMVPEYCVDGLVKEFIGWAQAVYGHADFYFVNSESTRCDLIKVGQQLGYEIDPDRIRTVRLDAEYRKSSVNLTDAAAAGNFRRHRLTPGQYVLFVSTIEARKNHMAMFDAWLELCKDHGDDAIPKLVCVGKLGWLNEATFARLSASARLREKVVMLSNVSDEELGTLYGGCLFSVYPSFYEGWGLPVTEALSHSKPVLASRNSSLPEAGGEFADYFDLGNAADLSAKLKRLIFNPTYRKERETAIRTGFQPRTWQSIAGDFQNAIAEWSVQDDTGRKSAPPIEFGRYYAFSQNNEINIYRGMRPGEMFRSGNSWQVPNEWGCWSKPGPAEIEFTLPDGAKSCRLYVGLRGSSDAETPFDLTVLPRDKVAGTLKPGEIKWVLVEFRATDTSGEVHVIVEGYTHHKGPPRTSLSPIAVVGLFICAASDTEARLRFIEAVVLDDMTGLTGIVPG